jgi:hypothetical protein
LFGAGAESWAKATPIVSAPLRSARNIFFIATS